MYRQQWQAHQQKQIIAKMAGKMPGNSYDDKRKNSERNTHNNNGGCSGGHQDNNGRGGHGRGRGGHGGRGDNSSDHVKTIECYKCGKKCHYSTDCTAPKKTDNKNSNMVSKADFKNLLQSSLKGMLDNKEKQNKKKGNMDVDDESLDMNVFDILVESKHNEIVSNNDYDSMYIENTNSLFHFGQNN
jgi:hypothetical protein